MKLKNFLLTAFSAAILMTGCQREEKNLGFPSLDVFRTSLSFEKELSSDTLSFVSTRAWKLESASPWISFDPESGDPSDGKTVVTITVLPNDSYDRTANVALNIGFTAVDITVNQLGKGSADLKYIYKNDFDKESAGTASPWPTLDKSECWKNQKGSGVTDVKHAYNGVSARNNSNSNGSYSDYDGSGVNNLFFGSDSYFGIVGLALNGEKNLKISFGSEKYDTDNKTALFDPAEFVVYVSKDTAKWVSVPYTYNGTEAGRWNTAEGTFTLSESPEKLCLLIVAKKASAYRLDDLSIEVAEEAGTAVNLNDPAAVSIKINVEGQGTSGGGGGGTTGDDVIVKNDYKTNGQGTSTINDVSNPDNLESIWNYDSKYGMKATAYVNPVNHASDSWLITPAVDLPATDTTAIEFTHAGNFFTDIKTEVHLLVSEASKEDWKELTIPTFPTGWTFVSSGKISLVEYKGKSVKFAFRYTSTSTKAGTWEIQDYTVAKYSDGSGSGSGSGTGPTGPSVKVDALSTGLTWTSNKDTTLGNGFKGENTDMTVEYYQASSTTAPVAPSSNFTNIKVYKNSVLIVTLKSGKNITGIKIKTTGANYTYDMSVDGGSTAKADTSTLTLVWTGKTKTFKATASGGQIRAESLEVFYEE